MNTTQKALENSEHLSNRPQVQMHTEWGPLGAARFLDLVRARVLDGMVLYRVAPHFLVQFGVPATKEGRSFVRGKISDDSLNKTSGKTTTVQILPCILHEMARWSKPGKQPNARRYPPPRAFTPGLQEAARAMNTAEPRLR